MVQFIGMSTATVFLNFVFGVCKGAGAFFLLIVVIGPWIVPFPEDATGAVHMDQKLRPPDSVHWFGTDEVGNDVFTRVVLGTRSQASR